MHKLPLSLLLVVLVGILGIGVVLDELFDRYRKTATTPLTEVQAFGQGLADMLNSSKEIDEITDHWPQNSAYDITLESDTDVGLPASLAQRLRSGEIVALESEQGVSLHFYLDQHDKLLSIQTGLTEGGDTELSWLLTIFFYIATLVLVLLWLRPLLRRLSLLRESTKSFGEGNLTSRIDARGITYIGDIEQGFNRMAERIQQLVEDNKLLTSAVSHDLRTPLARLRFGVDTLSDAPDTVSRATYIERINSDLDEMESLVESLLRYARLDNVMDGVEKQAINIPQLLEQCIAQYYDSDITITINHRSLSSSPSLILHGGIEHIATLFNNLLSNALVYANSQLMIDLRQENNCIVVKFCDDGPGIPKELRQLVVKPFERGDSGEGGNSGFGLGLAVATRIAQYHGGGIEIADCEELKGALVSVRLECG